MTMWLASIAGDCIGRLFANRPTANKRAIISLTLTFYLKPDKVA